MPAAEHRNISQLLYTGLNSGSKTFSYGYDKLNRLTTATSTGGMLDESLSYDRMGNITQLVRGNAGTLNYTSYTGNQLNTVTGYSPRSYAYDANGNATSDGISKAIYYNRLNLPRVVGSVATYTYDAAGQKLRNLGTDGSWDYISGSVYHNGAIAFVSTEEGRAEHKDDGSYNYEYNLKDHLGNSRVSMDYNPSNNTARVLQEDEYYSFGLRKGLYDLSNNNRYLYNGKEVQTDLANQYDYGARFYDPVIARWTTVDPLVEAGQETGTPYGYVYNNPMRYTDPDGRCPECLVVLVGGFETAGVVTGGTGGAGAPAGAVLVVGTLLTAGVMYVGSMLPVHSASGSYSASGSGRTTAARDNTNIKPQPIVKSAKGTNRVEPNADADGDHSTLKRDQNGTITGTATYKKNPKNPSGFDEVKRVDVQGGDHYDKKTGKKIPTPHVHEGKDTRPAKPEDLPNQNNNQNQQQNNQQQKGTTT